MNTGNHSPSGNGGSGGTGEVSLSEILSLLSGGKRLIAMTTLIVLLLVALYTFLTKPVYEATALVRIDTKAISGSPSFRDVLEGSSTGKITNEIETLKSYLLAERVSEDLFKRGSFDGNGSVAIPVLRKVDTELIGKVSPVQQVALFVRKMVEFSPVKESDLIKVSARSGDPREAALLANTYTKVYAEWNLKTSRSRSKVLREFLENQVELKHRSLDTTEVALQAYMRSSGMVSLDSEGKRVIEQLSQLEASRDAIGVEVTSRTKTLSSYTEQLATLEPSVAKSIEEYGDSYIRMLQEQLAKLDVQRDIIIAQNPGLSGESIYSQKLKEVDGQIAALRQNLQKRTRAFLTSVVPAGSRSSASEGTTGFLAELKQKIIEQRIELDGLLARQSALNLVIRGYEFQFNQIPQKSIELAKLQRARLSSEKLYLMIEEKYNEAAITESSELGYVVVVDPAVAPLKPVSPIIWLNMLLGSLLGVAAGAGVAVMRAKLDTKVRSPEDIQSEGHVVLATIGLLQLDGQRRRTGETGRESGKVLEAQAISLMKTPTYFAESFRHLRTSLQHAGSSKPLKTLLVTSPNPGEGKSTVALNLAIAFAEGEMKTLLLDADLRRPAIHTLCGLKERPGLTDMLQGATTFGQCRRIVSLGKFDIVCSGTPTKYPAALLTPGRIAKLLAGVTEEYEIIVIDSPPLLAVTDAAILASSVDGAVVVVRAGQTKMRSLGGALQHLERLGGHLLGTVLNCYEARKTYRASHGGEGYGHYGYEYGRPATPKNGISQKE